MTGETPPLMTAASTRRAATLQRPVVELEGPAARGLLRHRWWIFATIVALYAVAFNGHWRITDDGQSYVAWAHSLAEGTLNTPATVPRHFYPGLPALVAATLALFDSDGLAAAHVLLLGLGAAGLILTYAIVRRIAGAGVAVIVSLLVAVNYTYFEQSFRLLADLPLAVGILLATWGFLVLEDSLSHDTAGGSPAASRITGGDRARILAALAVVLGAAISMATKRAAWIVIIPMSLFFIMQALFGPRRRTPWLIAGLAIAAAAIVTLLAPRISAVAGDELYTTVLHEVETEHFDMFTAMMLQGSVAKFLNEVAAETTFGIEWGPGLAIVMGVLPLIGAAGLCLNRPIWTLPALLYILGCALKGPTPRYFLPVLPLLALGWWRLAVWVSARCPSGRANLVLVGFLTLWIAPNLVRVVGLLLEQRRQPFYVHYEESRYAPVITIAGWARDSVPDGALIAGPDPDVIEHFSGKTAVDLGNLMADQVDPRTLSPLWIAAVQGTGATSFEPVPGRKVEVAGLADFNSDGWLDLAWTEHDSGAFGFVLSPQSDSDRKVVVSDARLTGGFRVCGIGNFDADVGADVLLSNAQTGQTGIWAMRGTRKMNWAGIRRPADDWVFQAVGEFNGDSYSDIVWRNTQAEFHVLWSMEGRHTRDRQTVASPWRHWSMEGLYAEDAKALGALLWRSPDRNHLKLVLSNREEIGGVIDFPALPGSQRLVDIGDWNQDGRLDLIWQDSLTGRVMVWHQHHPVYVVLPAGTTHGSNEFLEPLMSALGAEPQQHLTVYRLLPVPLREHWTQDSVGPSSGHDGY